MMVWMPAQCPVCRSDLRSASSTCWNQDDAGVPCLGMSDSDAALKAAHDAFVREEIGLTEFAQRLEVALTDPPRRRFSVLTVLR